MAFFLQRIGFVPSDPPFLGGGAGPLSEPTLTKYSVLGFLKFGIHVIVSVIFVFIIILVVIVTIVIVIIIIIP